MDDVVLNLIVIISLAGTGIIIYLLVNRNKAKKKEQFLAKLAKLGWRVSPIQENKKTGWHIEATAPGKVLPFSWEMEAVVIQHAPSSDVSTAVNFSRLITWRTEAARSETGMVLLGPKLASNAPKLDANLVSSLLVQGALRMMIGDDAGQLPGLAEVETGFPSIRERWSVFAHHPAQADRLISSEVESALAAIPLGVQLILRLNQRCLQVEIRDRPIDDVDLMQKLAALGERLVEAWM